MGRTGLEPVARSLSLLPQPRLVTEPVVPLFDPVSHAEGVCVEMRSQRVLRKRGYARGIKRTDFAFSGDCLERRADDRIRTGDLLLTKEHLRVPIRLRIFSFPLIY
jgi:hypothetical protein